MSGEETEMQTLLKERGAAHNSLMMADEYLKLDFCRVLSS